MRNEIINRPILDENIHLTKSERKVFNFINSYIDGIFSLNQLQLAKKTKTSEGTISRFVKKFHFDNYRDFVVYVNSRMVDFANKYPIIDQKTSKTDPYMLITASYKYAIDNANDEKTIQECMEASKLIYEAKSVYIYGSGSSQRICMNLVANLLKIGKPAIANPDFHIFFPVIANASKDDLIIIFSNNLKSMESIFLIRKNTKAKVIIITSNHNIPKSLKYDLLINYSKIHDDTLLVPIGSKVAQLLIENIIFESLIKQYPENHTKLLKATKLINEWSILNKAHED